MLFVIKSVQLHELVVYNSSCCYRLCMSWRGDVQEIEGTNNLVQLATKTAPGISLALLDARVSLRKSAGLGSTATRCTRWSHIAAKAEDLINDAVEFHGKAK